MRRTVLATFLAGLGLGIALAWALEAVMVGRGVVSTYLAPVAIAAALVAGFLGAVRK